MVTILVITAWSECQYIVHPRRENAVGVSRLLSLSLHWLLTHVSRTSAS